VAKVAPHKDLRLIARGKLTFDGRVELNRVVCKRGCLWRVKRRASMRARRLGGDNIVDSEGGATHGFSRGRGGTDYGGGCSVHGGNSSLASTVHRGKMYRTVHAGEMAAVRRPPPLSHTRKTGKNKTVSRPASGRLSPSLSRRARTLRRPPPPCHRSGSSRRGTCTPHSAQSSERRASNVTREAAPGG